MHCAAEGGPKRRALSAYEPCEAQQCLPWAHPSSRHTPRSWVCMQLASGTLLTDPGATSDAHHRWTRGTYASSSSISSANAALPRRAWHRCWPALLQHGTRPARRQVRGSIASHATLRGCWFTARGQASRSMWRGGACWPACDAPCIWPRRCTLNRLSKCKERTWPTLAAALKESCRPGSRELKCSNAEARVHGASPNSPRGASFAGRTVQRRVQRITATKPPHERRGSCPASVRIPTEPAAHVHMAA